MPKESIGSVLQVYGIRLTIPSILTEHGTITPLVTDY